MPVNREVRDKLIDAIVGHMKREIRSFELDECWDKIYDEAIDCRDNSARDLAMSVWGIYDDFKDHTISVSCKSWDVLRRMLAFLKTDLEFDVDTTQKEVRPLTRFAAILSILMLALPCFVIPTWGWFPLMAVWFILGAVWAVAMTCGEPNEKDRDDDEYWPFASLEQWQYHEPLLKDLRLPEYDPERHRAPIRMGIDCFPVDIGISCFLRWWFICLFLPMILVGTVCSRSKAKANSQ